MKRDDVSELPTGAAAERWRLAVGKALGSPIRTLGRVSGGDFAAASRATLADGRQIFVKTHADPPPGFFTTEANGLRWLRNGLPSAAAAADAVIKVPQVLGVADDPPWLALDWIDVAPGGPPAAGEAAFGRALASLHASGAACFGREDGRTTGSLALPNDACADWVTFYAERRLLPLARLASDRGALPRDTIGSLERVAARLEDFGAAGEPPARLHGDLWAGNRIADQAGCSWLIDPAAHGGHREFDLAMMRLFGGYQPVAFDAYDEFAPLAPGWQPRIALHQLAPLVVHAIKFGGPYPSAVSDALRTLD